MESMGLTTKERIQRMLYRLKGDRFAGVVTVITGDQCPCMISRAGSDNVSYSASWHTDNPASDDCFETGLINRVTTNTDIKAIFTNELETLAVYLDLEKKETIGRIQDRDLLMFGVVKDSDGSWFDISNLKEQSDYITHNSVKYVKRHYLNVDEVIQIATLKRKETF